MRDLTRIINLSAAVLIVLGLFVSCGAVEGQESGGTGTVYYADTDGDGYGDPAVSQVFDVQPAAWVLDNTDCDDTTPAASPGISGETCGDGLDNDCDGAVDCADSGDCAAAPACVQCVDSDGDGYMAVDAGCPGSDDCDDSDELVNPDAPEICDDADNDCDGQVDEGAACGLDSGGVPEGGYPDWHERTLLVLTNAVRADPQGWRDTYYPYTTYLPEGSGILTPDEYSAVGPLYYNSSMNQGARYHSEDMESDCGLRHDSCDGTSWDDRLWSYYPEADSIGENVAYGFTSPLDTLNQFLCDRVGTACAPDGTQESGHRINIMRSQWKEAGMGFAPPHWWTQDFAWAGGAPDSTPALVAGSHVMTGTSLRYFVNYYAPGEDALEVDLVTNGFPAVMDLDLGAADNGTWSAAAPVPVGCRSYHFEARDSAGRVWRYPGEGEFKTYGAGGCGEDYEGP